jgi:hypothetical protein
MGKEASSSNSSGRPSGMSAPQYHRWPPVQI